MARRNPDSAAGDWYVDDACIDCGASRDVAPGMIVRRHGKSVFARQPADADDERNAWRAVLVCPTASVRTESHKPRPSGLFPHEFAPGVYRCGFNARASWGAHSYFVTRPEGNLLIDAPRYSSELKKFFENAGGIVDVLLSHQDDVADAARYARAFGSNVWIHRDDQHAAPYATHLIEGAAATTIRDSLWAIPVPGHTRGSVAYLLENKYLFTGDSLAWSFDDKVLTAFRDACWYSWTALTASLTRLLDYRFEWVLAGHGASVQLPAAEMNQRLRALIERMKRITA